MDRAELLKSSRFYGAKSEEIDDVTVVDRAGALGGDLELLAVTHGGVRDLYQVLVDASGRDILTDDDVATAYGRALVAGAPAGLGELHGAVPLADSDSTRGRAISGEQSNTSLRFGDPDAADGAGGAGGVMIKVFRRLEPGLSPDVELLSQIPDCPHVAPVRAWVTHEIDGTEHTLAIIQDFVAGGKDGWQFALDTAARGESFADEARALGRAIRAVHDALAEAFGTEEIDATRIAERLTGQAEELADRIPALAEHLPAARRAYDQLGAGAIPIQRVHGDLHLGQVLRTPERYVLIDFEGEPARPLAVRRLPDHPLRDVAGMLRSLDYAAHFPVAAGQPGVADPGAWAAEASAALLDGYGAHPSALLDAYLLDKALYEVGYEVNNRPDWAWIPLEAVARITR